jgi:hypothetical protein
MALAKRDLTYQEAVDLLGIPVHFTKLHKVARGQQRPSLELAVAIERSLAIPVEAWPHLSGPVTELLKLRGVAA